MGLIALFTMLFSMTACAAGTAPFDIEAGRDTEQTSAVSEFDFDSRTVLLNSGYTMPIMGLGTYAPDYDTCVVSLPCLYSPFCKHVLLDLVLYLSDGFILAHLHCIIQSNRSIIDLIFKWRGLS